MKTEITFTKEEIETAKATRQIIVDENDNTLKAVYMAGEIVMWDEYQSLTSEKDKRIEELEKAFKPDHTFWRRLKSFVSDIQVNCAAGDEEKEYILNTAISALEKGENNE